MQQTLWRPYLHEYVVGGGFEFGAFLALVGFILVIGLWLYSASPMIGNAFSFFKFFKTDEKQAVTTSKAPDISQAAVVSTAPGLAAVVPTLTPEPTKVYSTATPYPTYTPYPTLSIPDNLMPVLQVLPAGSAVIPPGYTSEDVKIRLSYYFPAYGGINCDVVDGLPECLHIADGSYYTQGVGTFAACPPEWNFGDYVKVGDLVFECRDRGGAIVKQDDYYWVDILYPYMPSPYVWGQLVDGQHYKP